MTSRNAVPNFDFVRYTNEPVYREAVDAVLTTLSVHLKIPFYELYNGLFFYKGTAAKGMVIIKNEPSPEQVDKIRAAWHKHVIETSPMMTSFEAPPEMRAQIIQDARDHWQNHWPEQLDSGIMFFKGERITKDEFDGRN